MADDSVLSTERVLDALLHALDEGALVFDGGGVCRSASRRAAEILGLDAAALPGLARAELLGRVANAADAPATLGPLDDRPASSEGGERTVVDPIVLARPVTLDGAPAPRSGLFPRTVVWTSVPIGAAGRLDLIRDVTRERRAEAAVGELAHRLEMESTLDDLTGLVNRKRFEEECLREHRRAQREWITYAIARVDVDGMGAVNERLGRAVGDALLKRVGEDLRASRREYDVVARWTDDELVLLLPRADVHALGSVLKRARDAVHAGGASLVPGMSVCVGAALWTPPSAEGPADILRRAATALAAARARGPGHIDVDLAAGEWKGISDEGTGSEG
jgi:diguanylate cyclase (GGDEF)-like protein